MGGSPEEDQKESGGRRPEGEGEKNYRKDEAKVTPIEMSLTDGKVEDVMRQVQKDEDV